MASPRYPILALVLFLCAGLGDDSSSGVRARALHEEPEGVQVTGRITISGNDPFSFVAIHVLEPQDTDGSYRLQGDLVTILKDDYQQKTVTIRIRVTKERVGPGFPAEAEVLEILTGGE